MQVIRDAAKSADLPYGVVATIGNYDGIHRGQRRVLERVVERAHARGVQGIVVTFEPHPLAVLRPEETPKRLTTPEQREQLLAELGVDALVILRFDEELAKTSAEEFVRRVLHQRLAVEEVYVGAGFTFGHRRRGDLRLLEQLGAELGFTAEGIEEVVCGGDVVSSSLIRRLVAAGEVERAMELLGRPYALCGTVVRGDRMGVRLGWPTLNLHPDNELLPADGVYTGRAHLAAFPTNFDCVTNVGTRPTVYENYQRVVESHVLDFHADVYGERVEIRFFKRLREEKLFPSVMDLAAQIARDVETTREYFAARRRLHQEG